MNEAPPMASLEGLPEDVLAHVFELLSASDLARLREVSRWMDRRVQHQGIPLYLSQHRVCYSSLSPPAEQWPSTRLFNYQASFERAIGRHALHAVQVGAAWARKCLPVLSLDGGRLLVGAGGDILLHPLVPPAPAPHQHPRKPVYGAKAVAPPQAYTLSQRSDSDLVGLHALPGGEVVSAQFDGTLQRLALTPQGCRSTAHYSHPREHIYALSGHESAFLALSLGAGRLYAARSPWVPPAEFAVAGRPWSGLLTDAHAYVGVRGEVSVYALRPSGPTPLLSLRASNEPGDPFDLIDSMDALDAALGRAARRSTPYSVATKGGVVLSAWHDGAARVHDLRTGRAEMELSDPWQDAPLYCAAFLGAHSVAAGGSQHGIVSVFDLRNAAGWSVFSPEGKGSPVYALAADGARVWGVSERRAFVLAFDGSGGHAGGIHAYDPLDSMYGNGRGGRSGRGMRSKDIPTGYRRRGGKWGWTVGYGEQHARASCMGYRHEENGTALFETLLPA